MDIKEFAQEFIENVKMSVELTEADYDKELATSILEYMDGRNCGMFRVRFSAADVAVMLICLLLALLLLLTPLSRTNGAFLTVTTPTGSHSYSLSENQTITAEGNGLSLTVQIENGEARVIHSDCPDKICHSGAISKSGQSILCAPAGIRLLISAEKGGSADVDFVAG